MLGLTLLGGMCKQDFDVAHALEVELPIEDLCGLENEAAGRARLRGRLRAKVKGFMEGLRGRFAKDSTANRKRNITPRRNNAAGGSPLMLFGRDPDIPNDSD